MAASLSCPITSGLKQMKHYLDAAKGGADGPKGHSGPTV
jgi:hypothetical protein